MSKRARKTLLPLSATFAAALACSTGGGASAPAAQPVTPPGGAASAVAPGDVDKLLIVDCVLPGQVRKMGRRLTYMTPRRPVRTSALDCEIRGGEYVSYDRADYRTALAVWKPMAEQGDAEAQNYVGEIYERGLGVSPDYAQAADWYRKAAEQNFAPAQINLGQLYDKGLGVPQDPALARQWYARGSGLEGSYVSAPSSKEQAVAMRNAKVALPGPTLQIVEPDVPPADDGYVVPAGSGGDERTVAGHVDAPAGLQSLTVNGKSSKVGEDGIFQEKVALRGVPTNVTIVATDAQGKRAQRSFQIDPKASAASRAADAPAAAEPPRGISFGRYHALVIGESEYVELPKLRSSVVDARAVAEVLTQKYGFETTTLFDATRYQILTTLNQLRETLGEQDNLLIYYAGHGEYDEVNQRGQWLPIDAQQSNDANWISNVALTDIMKAMHARHVMVIADSCYSGALTRAAVARLDTSATDAARAEWLRTMVQKRSRTALTSGGLQPVLDSGGGAHSVFAATLLEVLRTNEGVIEGQRLFQEIAARTAWSALFEAVDQVPEYAPIQFAGHEAGDFFFIPKSVQVSQAAPLRAAVLAAAAGARP
jgi:uncharacterized caspase-like protein